MILDAPAPSFRVGASFLRLRFQLCLSGRQGLTYAQNHVAFTACYRKSKKSGVYFYPYDFAGLFLLPLFSA
jgi:hypothetical protein